MLAAQRAILHVGSNRRPLSRPSLTRRCLLQRAWPCALRCHHRSAHLHHAPSLSFSCAWALALDAASSSLPEKSICGPGASASARLAPWKGHRRCTFPRRRPPRHLRPSWPRSRTSQSAFCTSRQLQICSHTPSERLRSRLDPLDREERGLCAHGGDWPAKVLRKRKFHRKNPLELETPKPGVLLATRPSDLGLD